MSVDRRTFLTGALAGGATLGVGACRSGDDASPTTSAPAERTDPDAATGPENLGGGEYLEFEGRHQTGIAAPTTEDGLLVAFRCTASDRDELAAMFQALTDESRRLMTGEPYEERQPAFPPLHTGHVGNPAPPVNLSVVTSVGASLFDDRFGLADRRPRDLVKMPFLANDRLDPDRSHGDVLLTIASGHEDVNLFALRQLMRVTRSSLTLHWMLEGYNRRTEACKGEAGVR
ncbi:MAG: Dyp-type peroxidase, partial [Actinomycetota bacterium]|nr:Dyp-type peroxidase [Actinomycetota bacterium]